MRKGFTIIELLVASLLLGMLVTILTMIFNQSSIAWRIGSAVTSDMDDMRDNMAALREEADNAFVYGTEVYRTVGLWKEDGTFRDRACDAPKSAVKDETGTAAALLNAKARNFLLQRKPWRESGSMIDMKKADDGNAKANYIVNVMSKGPNNNEDDWQAIFSYPDDPEEWCK